MRASLRNLARQATLVARKAQEACPVDLDPILALKTYCELRSAIEQEETLREEIRAKRDVAVTSILAHRDMLDSYFRLRFAERKAVLDELFKVLTHASDAANDAELDRALCGILSVVKDNPLSDFESFRKAWLEGNTIEI